MVIYESKNVKIEIKDNGVLAVDEGGRKLNIDLKIFSLRKDDMNVKN